MTDLPPEGGQVVGVEKNVKVLRLPQSNCGGKGDFDTASPRVANTHTVSVGRGGLAGAA